MSMTPRERMLAVLNGEEPDKVPVAVFEGVLAQHPGEWSQRLQERGMALMRHAMISEPGMWTPRGVRPREDRFRYGLLPDPRFRYGTRPEPRLTDLRYTRTDYFEKGLWKYRQTWETPVGSITGVMMTNPWDSNVGRVAQHPEEYVVKQPSDWRVVNYFLKGALDNLAPTTYESFERAEEELGDGGIAYAFLSEYL